MPRQFQIKDEKGETIVWFLSESEEWLMDQIVLSDNEIIKFNKISNSLRRRSFLAIRIMLKEAGISEVEYLENGKPIINNGFISISHSGNWLGIRYSENHQIGLDIEKIHSRILKIKDRFLSETEETEVCSGDIEKMILCWSAKEAIFKKYGGETVFFREKIKVLNIDSVKKEIAVKIWNDESEFIETLSYFYPEDEYVLVHTL
jgi:phosphopantetheinyl transferase